MIIKITRYNDLERLYMLESTLYTTTVKKPIERAYTASVEVYLWWGDHARACEISLFHIKAKSGDFSRVGGY